MRKPLLRKSQSCLNDDEIARLYKCILVSVENDNPKLNGYKKDSPKMKKVKTDLGFDFGNRNEIKTDANARDNTFYFKHYNGHSNIPSLFLRIRDAFSHNRIFKDDTGNIVLEDCNNGKLTMYARISSIDKLIDIINGIKNTRNSNIKTTSR